MEVETQLQIAARLNYLDSVYWRNSSPSARKSEKMLNGLVRSLNPESLIPNPE